MGKESAMAVERSSFGDFATSEETKISTAILSDIYSDSSLADEIVFLYESAVDDKLRRSHAFELVNSQQRIEGPSLAELTELLFFSGQQRLAAKYGLLLHAYDNTKDYSLNAIAPWRPAHARRPTAGSRKWSVLGKIIGFPIGIPASPLTSNSAWIEYFARAGFNVLTYKTVRSRKVEAHSKPNWVFLEGIDSPFDLNKWPASVIGNVELWVQPGDQKVSSANSFGVPSRKPAQWQEDIAVALDRLASDQLLIVSVMGDDYDAIGDSSVLAADYVRVAKMAEEAGAEAIELNLSCPNSLDKVTNGVLKPICFDENLTTEIVHAVREAVRPETRLLAKLSYLPFEKLYRMLSAVGNRVDAYTGINTEQCDVRTSNGVETFPGRAQAGVSGYAIRNYALDFVKSLTRLRVILDQPYEIIGMGGVTDSDSFRELFDSGATVVQTASGAFSNWRLAGECVAQLGADLAVVPDVHDLELERRIEDQLLRLVGEDRSVNKYFAATSMPVPSSQTFAALDRLERLGKIRVLS